MDMGEDDTFMATIETNKQHALSLLDLPNPRSDTTDSLTPHKFNNKGGNNHNNTGMDTCTTPGTNNCIENTATKPSTNYSQTRNARRANHTQETHNLDTGNTTHTQQSIYSNFDS